ncbi:MAG: hypothetical protein PHF70_05630 [Opitutales bacterium]|nr:hypothetical protein [Opitutales bacterium]
MVEGAHHACIVIDVGGAGAACPCAGSEASAGGVAVGGTLAVGVLFLGELAGGGVVDPTGERGGAGALPGGGVVVLPCGLGEHATLRIISVADGVLLAAPCAADLPGRMVGDVLLGAIGQNGADATASPWRFTATCRPC